MRAVRHVERRFAGGGLLGESPGPDSGLSAGFVEILAASPLSTAGGYYTGRFWLIDNEDIADLDLPPPWVIPEDDVVRVVSLNAGVLVEGQLYTCSIVGEFEKQAIAVVSGGGTPAGHFPACGTSAGESASPADCVIWYTNYLHVGAVAVAVGESLTPGQLVGYIGFYAAGAHLHFALGDGDPLISPGYLVPIAGKTVNVTTWLGFTVAGPRSGCQRGSMGDANFTAAELSYIQTRFAPPVKGTGWVSAISSPYHCDYDYHALDLLWPPGADQAETGQPVYNACSGADVVTTVEAVTRHPLVGYAVLLRHQSACCPDPDDAPGSDPHDDTGHYFPGRPPVFPPGTPYPPGVPHPHEPATFHPVTRLCVGPVEDGMLIGRIGTGEGPLQVIKIGPGLKLVGGVLRYDAVTAGDADPVPLYQGVLLPITVEKTAVTVPVGMLIGGTTCAPPATSCCDGPTDPCPVAEWDPILPIVLTGPFGAACALFTLVGELSWDDGEGEYTGFVYGLIGGGVGFVADVQLEFVSPDWVLHVQFVGDGDGIQTEFDIVLVPCGDGTVLCGTATVDRPACSGTAVAEVGHPCPVGGWPGGDWDGAGINVPCGNPPATLTFAATQTGGAACTPSFPTGGSATSGSPGVWSFGATAGCSPFPSGWTVTITCDAGVYSYEAFENATPVAAGTLTVTAAAPFAASATATISGAAGCCPNTTWTFEFTA